ncbi:hypothetical protein FHW36_10512 [Chitinophaga polysaccharea]|uniref:Natural product n=1 Tax=Chitinophaga polysaccharea TaxID=1293035 RepID=A0A561PN89_9BACT|nr:hypothetical protein [Chitinophaga polysaccharea]TWF39575.1 hypothetical protein FHW36_10512 [Chitinophaga polysaccharea]
MKKLKLKTLGLGIDEVLTREQLKNVLGGSGSSGSGDKINCNVYGTTGDGTPYDFTGPCASLDPASCNSYAQAQCDAYMTNQGGTCNWGCF